MEQYVQQFVHVICGEERPMEQLSKLCRLMKLVMTILYMTVPRSDFTMDLFM